jgi:hypothetical protein
VEEADIVDCREGKREVGRIENEGMLIQAKHITNNAE